MCQWEPSSLVFSPGGGGERSRGPIQKSAYREGAFFCFSKLSLWLLQEPLNHKAPIITAVHNPALPSGTSAIVETFYIRAVQHSGR